MSWEETYTIWNKRPDLAPEVREDLDKIANDNEALEDAFYTSWDAWFDRCWDQPHEYLYCAPSN